MGFTAHTGRAHFAHRLSVVASSRAQMQERLCAFARGEPAEQTEQGRVERPDGPRVAFLFTGQGSQYVGMGRELFATEPVFRRALEECDALLRAHLERPLIEVLYPAEGQASPLDETEYTQPALFAVEYALSAQWKAWGIEPFAVLGHSVGEYVAACVAGVMGLEQGLGLIATRGRLMQALPKQGAMAALFADEATVAEAVRPYAAEVSVAAVNGPSETVVSGARGRGDGGGGGAGSARGQESVAERVARVPLAADGADGGGVRACGVEGEAGVAAAEADRERDGESGAGGGDAGVVLVEACAGACAVHGGDTGAAGGGGGSVRGGGAEPSCSRRWGGGACRRGQGCGCRRCGRSARIARRCWRALGRCTCEARRWTSRGFDRDRARRKLVLPTYPFQRERCWIDPPPRSQPARPVQSEGPAGGHPLLGQRLRSPAIRGVVFETRLSSRALPFLNDHQVFDVVIFPATAYLELAFAAGAVVLGPAARVLEQVVIHEALPLPAGEERALQIVLVPGGAGEASFEIFSARAEPFGGEVDWRLHASGAIRAKIRATSARPRLSMRFARVTQAR